MQLSQHKLNPRILMGGVSRAFPAEVAARA